MSDYTSNQWASIKKLAPSSRMVHVSKAFYVNPMVALAEQAGVMFTGPRFLPHPGVTLNLGLNKAKRERRDALLRQKRPVVK
jgi:hypothetical protein